MEQARTLQASSQLRVNRFLAQVYFLMAFGMAITALVATWVSTNEALLRRVLFDAWFVWILFIIQIVVVAALSAAVMRMSPGAALLLFLLYSALTGITISSIFFYYSKSTIAYTFWMTAGMFLLTSIVGMFIKRDLGNFGMFLMFALMGWLFGWIITWFFPLAKGLNQLMNFSGILLFAALTVFDTQRLKLMAKELEGRQGMGGIVVLGALSLYLDFINMFLLLLRTSNR
jgi:FtsH-binding integral membrane protein